MGDKGWGGGRKKNEKGDINFGRSLIEKVTFIRSYYSFLLSKVFNFKYYF